MKTKTNARILAWLLSICLIAGILPAMPANYAQAADGDLVYNFSAAATNATGGSGLYIFTTPQATEAAGQHTAGVFEDVATYEVTKSLGSAPFDIFYAYKSRYCQAAFYGNIGLALFTRSGGNGSEIRMNIKVAESGWYTLSTKVNNGIGTTDSTLRLRLYEGIENDINEANIIVDSSCNPALAISTNYLNDNKAIYLDSTKKYVAHYSSHGAGSRNGNFYIYDLTLTRQYPDVSSSEAISTVMAKGASVKTKFDVTVGGSSMENVTITEASSSDTAVSISPESDGSYTIAAVKDGSAAITVKATYGEGTEISKTYYISVRNAPDSANPVYYYSGISNKTYYVATVDGPQAKEVEAAQQDVSYATTAAKSSSPWTYHGCYISTNDKDNTITLNPDNILITSNGAGVAAYIRAQVTPGWYTIDTDYDCTNPTQKAKLTAYEYTTKFGNVIYANATSLDQAFDFAKAIYIPTDIVCFIYSLESSSGGGKTATLYSTALNAATPALEAASEVKTAYTVGDAATTVNFTVGAMTPSNVTASSDNAAVTAVASGTGVTFTPVSAGTANVKVTATYGTTSVDKTYTITVSEEAASAFTLGFGSSNGGVALANIYNATIAANKWAINTDETDMIDQLTNTGRHGMNADYTNFKIYEDEVLAYDFEAAVAGDYELVLCVGENTDYGVNAEVFVNNVSVGKMFNDENGSSATLVLKNKGFGKVALNKGVNTLKIKGLAPDVIDSVTKTGSDRAGGTQLYLSTATFTPKEASDVVVDRVEITCPDTSISVGTGTSVSAKAIMSDGSEVAVTPKTITSGIIDSASGTVTGIGAGLALVEAEYEKDGVLYEDQVVIAVTNDAVFGNVYAYIDNDIVTFLGGIKTIAGYKEVGFDVYYGNGSEINVGTGYANPVSTTSVYKKLVVGGQEYGAAYFGAGEDGYIFHVNETAHVTAGETILIRPYVIDLDGNKIPYGQQYTMVVK